MKHQKHYFPIISLAIVAGFIALLATVQLTYSALVITTVVVTYFVANIAYGIYEKSLTAVRVIEIGLVAIIVEYTALIYFT